MVAKSGVFIADDETRRALTGLDPEHGCKARATRDDIAQVAARRIKKNGYENGDVGGPEIWNAFLEAPIFEGTTE